MASCPICNQDVKNVGVETKIQGGAVFTAANRVRIAKAAKISRPPQSFGFYANRVAYFAKHAGIAMTIAAGVTQSFNGYQDKNSREISKGLTGIGTTFFGGWSGEILGASVGSAIFPGIGTFLGGLIGGVGAAYSAGVVGDMAVDAVHNKFGNDLCDDCKIFRSKSKEEIKLEAEELIKMLEEKEQQNNDLEVEKRNLEEEIKAEHEKYLRYHPIPEKLKEHRDKHPKAFYIQFIGARGCGKSTLINRIFRKAKLSHLYKADTGVNETTKDTAFYDITDTIIDDSHGYDYVFLVDQPGIGGKDITESNYLQKYGPGHFDFTFLLSDNGFNEYDQNLLDHLMRNNRPCSYIRTKCDTSIFGIQEQYENNDAEIDDERAFAELRTKTLNFMQNEVMSKIDTPTQLDILFIGQPKRLKIKEFYDLTGIYHGIFSGNLIRRIQRIEYIQT